MMNPSESYKEDIISRYVYAVTKRLPFSQRADIEKELRSLIDDMLLERCGDNAPTSKDIDEVLIELGAPDELAQRYSEHPNYLIGPEYYDTYLLIMKIVIPCVTFGLFIANVVLAVFSSGQNIITAVGSFLAATFMALVQAFAFITLGFAGAEYFKRKGRSQKPKENWYPNMLPPLQPQHKEIKKSEAITGIIFSCLIIILFNFAPQLIGFYFFSSEMKIVPIFNMEYYNNVLPLFNLCFILGLAREIIKLTIGRYTVGLCVATIVANLASLITVFFIFNSGKVLNPSITAEFQKIGTSGTGLQLFYNFEQFFLAVIAFALILDIAVVVIRTIKLQIKL